MTQMELFRPSPQIEKDDQLVLIFPSSVQFQLEQALLSQALVNETGQTLAALGIQELTKIWGCHSTEVLAKIAKTAYEGEIKRRTARATGLSEIPRRVA